MMHGVDAGQVLQLAKLVSFKEGEVNFLKIVESDHMRFALLAFHKNSVLREHPPPGDAMIFALEGQANLSYEGRDYVLKAGDQFKFDKGGKHLLSTGDSRFIMALVIEKE